MIQSQFGGMSDSQLVYGIRASNVFFHCANFNKLLEEIWWHFRIVICLRDRCFKCVSIALASFQLSSSCVNCVQSWLARPRQYNFITLMFRENKRSYVPILMRSLFALQCWNAPPFNESLSWLGNVRGMQHCACCLQAETIVIWRSLFPLIRSPR